MARNYHRIERATGKRQSNTMLVSLSGQQQDERRMTTFINGQRRLSIMSQISLPHGAEYHPQRRLPPNGIESRQQILLRNIPTMIEHNPKQVHGKSIKKPKTIRKSVLTLSMLYGR
ncbi:unnamed protein product [Adineta ricciae]|uniref:Uncharacterized protein n=1 Tax=Adineta ricciae TaxID=249248 RepID=A0A815MHB3_ADIRI|nr:unnamed protein product [Adineta ricciae]